MRPTCESHIFNGGYAHLLYKNREETCRKMKTIIYLNTNRDEVLKHSSLKEMVKKQKKKRKIF